MRRLLALPVALLTTACFPQAELAQCVSRGFPAAAPLAVPVVHLGEEAAVPITWESGTSCPESTRAVLNAVRVELTGPDNLPVEVSGSAPLVRHSSIGMFSDTWESTARFTPRQAGSHHLIASFEPQGGLVTVDLWVAQDHRFEQPASTALTAGTDCFRVERTRQGSELCSTFDARVLLFKNGALRNSWLSVSGRVDGDAIWLSANSRVFRYADLPDGGLESTSLTAEIGPTFWVAENEMLHWVRDASNHVHFDGTALATVGRVSSLTLSVTAVALDPVTSTVVAGTRATWARFPADVAVDGGVLFTDTDGAIHQDRDGIWLEDKSGVSPSGIVRFAPADARKPLLELRPPDGWLRTPGPFGDIAKPGERPLFFPRRAFDPQETAPQLDFAEVLVPVVRGDRVELWHFVAPDNSSFSDVTGGVLRATRAGGEHLFFPVTP